MEHFPIYNARSHCNDLHNIGPVTSTIFERPFARLERSLALCCWRKLNWPRLSTAVARPSMSVVSSSSFSVAENEPCSSSRTPATLCQTLAPPPNTPRKHRSGQPFAASFAPGSTEKTKGDSSLPSGPRRPRRSCRPAPRSRCSTRRSERSSL